MTVADFIKQLPGQQTINSELLTKNLIRIKASAKRTRIMNEEVMHGGNDMWLADELEMNRAEVEKIATQKPAR